jgi:hypothetical protein
MFKCTSLFTTTVSYVTWIPVTLAQHFEDFLQCLVIFM